MNWYDMVTKENTVEASFLSIKEFARHLSIHPNTVRRSIKNGRLSAVKVGCGKKAIYRIPKSEINRIALLDLKEIVDTMVEEKIKSLKG